MTLTIGVDVGGTKVEAILFDGKKIIKTARVPSMADKSYAVALGQIIKAIEQVRVPNVKAVGLATPGYIKEGKLYGAPNNKSLAGKKLSQDISKRIKLPVAHENDAKLFGFAEARHGAGKGKKHVIGLIVGTGVGAGVIVNGEILRGVIGAAGEVGHMPYLQGDYEHYTSGPALQRLYAEATGKQASAEHILKMKHAVVDIYYDHLARLCTSIIRAYNPEMIIFGGGVSRSLDIKRIRAEAKAYFRTTVMWETCAFKQFAISDSAGAIGAAILAAESVEKKK